MDQQLPFDSKGDRFFSIAGAVQAERPILGQVYLQPFAEALRHLDDSLHGFGPNDIVKVLQAWEAWETTEDFGWEGGFLVELEDGRRAHIELEARDFDWSNHAKIRVEIKPWHFDFLSPDVPKNHLIRCYGWTDEPPELMAFLERLRAV